MIEGIYKGYPHLFDEIIKGKSEILNKTVDGVLYLSSLRSISLFKSEIEIEKKINDNYFDDDGNIRIYTGERVLKEIHKLLDGGEYEYQPNLNEYKVFLTKYFFNDNIIDFREKDGEIEILFNNKWIKFYDLSDGHQSIFYFSFALFINDFYMQDKQVLFFIEEPELYLHPDAQYAFVKLLQNEKFKNFQFFITTHSNHFIDFTLDKSFISLFKFEERDGYFEIENVNDKYSDILEVLGVRNTSSLIANCSIWVEGITDRMYLRKYLEIFFKIKDNSYIEGVHYTFVEYAGSNITHWGFEEYIDNIDIESNIFTRRITNKLFLISDNDGCFMDENVNELSIDEIDIKLKEVDEKDKLYKKKKRILNLKKVLGDDYNCLFAREIENTISAKIVIQIIQEIENNEGIKLSFNFEDYRHKKLTDFLITIKKENDKIINDYNFNNSYFKQNFAKKAINKISNLSDLSNEAVALTEKVFKFIEENNSY